MTVTFTGTGLPDGTVLMMGIRYPNSSLEYTYAMLRAKGLWYVTGSGRVPIAAGWPAVERWLAKDDRTVIWVRAATEWATLWPAPQEPDDDLSTMAQPSEV